MNQEEAVTQARNDLAQASVTLHTATDVLITASRVRATAGRDFDQARIVLTQASDAYANASIAESRDARLLALDDLDLASTAYARARASHARASTVFNQADIAYGLARENLYKTAIALAEKEAPDA